LSILSVIEGNLSKFDVFFVDLIDVYNMEESALNFWDVLILLRIESLGEL
jgi:hypothetical protein